MEVPRASEGSGGHAFIQEFRVHSSSRTVDSPSPRLFKFRFFSSSSLFEFEFGELSGADLAFEFELAALAELELELFSRLRPWPRYTPEWTEVGRASRQERRSIRERSGGADEPGINSQVPVPTLAPCEGGREGKSARFP